MIIHRILAENIQLKQLRYCSKSSMNYWLAIYSIQDVVADIASMKYLVLILVEICTILDFLAYIIYIACPCNEYSLQKNIIGWAEEKVCISQRAIIHTVTPQFNSLIIVN